VRRTFSIVPSFICVLWCFIFSCFFLKDWCPLSIHPLSLFFRQLPFWHKDFLAAFIKIFRTGIPETFYIIIFTLSAAGLGALILKPVKQLFTPLQHLIFSLAAGMALLGYYTFFLGLLGYYSTAGLIISWLVVGLCSLGGGIFIYRLSCNNKLLTRLPLTCIPLLLIVALTGCFLFAKALLPVTHIDAVIYHLGVPNYYLQEGRIAYIPYDAFSNFPFMSEMLYTLAMFLSGVKSAQVMCVFVFFMLLATVYAFSKRFLTGIPAWLPMFFCMAVPSFMQAAILVKNDLHFALYILLAVYCFFEWEETDKSGWLLLAGCCMGVCASIKYTALIFLPIPALAGLSYITLKKRKRGIFVLLGTLTKVALPALIVFSPWLIRNYLWTDNPFYPGLYGLFGGKDMSETMAAAMNKLSQPPTDFSAFLRGLWEHPLSLAMGTQEAFDRYGIQWNMGPLFLLFIPMLAVIKNISPIIKKLLVLSLTFFVLWNATFTVFRFLYPAVLLGMIAAAYAAAMTVKHSAGPIKFFIAGICGLYLIMMFNIGFYTVSMHTMQYGMDGVYQSDETYLGKHTIDNPHALFDGLFAQHYINTTTLPTAKILLIGDVQHLYIKRRHGYTYLSATSPYQLFKNNATDPEQIARSLKANGYTHIYYNPVELSRLQDVGVIGYAEEDNIYIEKFLQSNFVTCVYAKRRIFITAFVYELL